MPFAAAHVADDPPELDVLFAATRRSLTRQLRAYEPDLALCTGFPWLIPQETLDVPRLGIVNGHPSLLPRYRGPPVVAELLPIVFDRLAAGDRGDPQEGGEYQSMFEQEYWTIDLGRAAADVHRQVRAWSFVPPIQPDLGPFLDLDGERVRVTRTSLTEVDGATAVKCADGPLWIVESQPASFR